jgi:hypothetical protein
MFDLLGEVNREQDSDYSEAAGLCFTTERIARFGPEVVSCGGSDVQRMFRVVSIRRKKTDLYDNNLDGVFETSFRTPPVTPENSDQVVDPDRPALVEINRIIENNVFLG